jgi:CO/xanthine dehydrogenase FAD-binding subunit
MITDYYRPEKLSEALKLIARPNTVPLGGGTWLNLPHEENLAVVDLQALGLNKIRKKGKELEVGATVTLQGLFESEHTPAALKAALKLEAPINLRNMGTVAGTLVTADGRSPFTTAMLALDAKLVLAPGDESLTIGNLLPLRRELLPGKLIVSVSIPLPTRLAFEYVARTPSDKPIVVVALCQWQSGRTRLALGGFSKSPLLGMDGTDASGVAAAARNAFHEAADEWASAEYRMDAAATLAKRCLEALS